MAYIDDLKHHRVPLSNLETVTDLYTNDVISQADCLKKPPTLCTSAVATTP